MGQDHWKEEEESEVRGWVTSLKAVTAFMARAYQ